MVVSLFRKGYRVIFLTSLFDLFMLDAKIETVCKVKGTRMNTSDPIRDPGKNKKD